MGKKTTLNPRSSHLTMHALSLRRFCRLVSHSGVIALLTSSALAQVDTRATAANPAALRQVQRRVVVEGLTESLQNLRITNLSGQDISAQVQARAEDGKTTLNLAQPTAVVLKPTRISTLALPVSGKITLPGGAVVQRPGGATPGTLEKAMWFRITFGASPMPAPWDDKEGSYVTQLTFGLKRPDGAPPALKLDQPVIVKLAYQGLTAPETTLISLEAAGLENEKTVTLRFTPQTAKPKILVRSTIADVDLELTALPRLAVQPDHSRLLGLGLDVATVNITNVQPDGRSAPVQKDTPVAVTVEGGRLQSESVTLKAGEATTHFTIRSAGLRPIAIRATADGVSGGTMLRQVFPFGPLIAALLGGAIGGFARRFVKGARRASNGRRLLEGVLVGCVVFVAGVLGLGFIDLPETAVPTEAGAFLAGVIGGFTGVSLLEVTARRKVASSDN